MCLEHTHAFRAFWFACKKNAFDLSIVFKTTLLVTIKYSIKVSKYPFGEMLGLFVDSDTTFSVLLPSAKRVALTPEICLFILSHSFIWGKPSRNPLCSLRFVQQNRQTPKWSMKLSAVRNQIEDVYKLCPAWARAIYGMRILNGGGFHLREAPREPKFLLRKARQTTAIAATVVLHCPCGNRKSFPFMLTPSLERKPRGRFGVRKTMVSSLLSSVVTLRRYTFSIQTALTLHILILDLPFAFPKQEQL